ncbi:uncharacterized protein K441DRAFT_697715 [Cenococcum geophilum 1.58]|uniref:uncharacterized protein n=1 Tax=Cenococcum geophilum 1.58 TaxID=794803 RepID=UPI00358F6D42|nr:hypothetical protein K441DRAFT_697715 [Cenococcum geophilum 1.58]
MEIVLQFSDTKPSSKRNPNLISTTRNSVTSLLRLPRELRDCIWEYVCGGQLIHVKNSYGLCCYICKATDSPRTMYLRTLEEPNNEYYEKHALNPEIKSHVSCYGRNKLNLEFQRTSRQIYHETTPIIYGMNIFSFSNAMIWFRFMITLKPQFRALIKCMQLDITISKFRDCGEWSETLTIPLVCSLTGLKTLHVFIWLKLGRPDEFRKIKEHMMKDWEGLPEYEANEQKILYTGLGRLQRLPLDDVTCVVCDDEFVYACDDLLLYSDNTLEQLEQEYKWTVADKRRLAERVRTVLLEPWDEVEYQKELEQKKKSGRKDLMITRF